MTTRHIANSIVSSYPEENPFEADPPIYNLTPGSAGLDVELDTPGFRAEALAIAQETGKNPLHTQYGTNPFVITDPRVQKARLPLATYVRPDHGLPRLSFSDHTAFLAHIHSNIRTIVITVRIDGEVRLLKIVRSSSSILLHAG